MIAAVMSLALLAGACTTSSHGPWIDANGRQLQNSEIVEFDGFNRCDQRSVTFFRLYDRQYAKDLEGALGELYSPVDGELLSFTSTLDQPVGVEGTGFRHENRELYVDIDTVEDYVYLVYDNGVVERWPRAEDVCQ
jgi:hypothetical protein